jgi:pyrroloquinoline quinone biosynthesis protein E
MPDDLAITDPTFDPSAPPLPTAMLAELTHRCPLKCPYCSNPTEMIKRSGELSTDEWIDVFTQAAQLGILHVHLSGGEPAARSDLPKLRAQAYRLRQLPPSLLEPSRTMILSTGSCLGLKFVDGGSG